MSATIDKLISRGIITDAPAHIKNNVHYEVVMGSTAYGVSNDDSDRDVYGFSIPPKNMIFPYSMGYVYGFSESPETFKQYQKHHIKDIDNGIEYDYNMYSIVKFFRLCMENNPNMVDSLFVPTRCVLHSTRIGNHVREKRHMFLSKRVWHSFKGYAFSQLNKMKNKYAVEFVELCKRFDVNHYMPLKDLISAIPSTTKNYSDVVLRMTFLAGKVEHKGKRSKRLDTIAEYGYDVKFGYHVIRLLDECEQMLEYGDMDLTRARSHMKAIRNGEWTVDQIMNHFDTKMAYLENLYGACTVLPYSPDEPEIKNLLLECIEMHYGSLEGVVPTHERLVKYLIEAQKNIDNALKNV